MGVNRGKDFEAKVREGFEKVPDCDVTRLSDQMSGYYGSKNPCDFIIYKKPFELCLECKSCYGNTLNFKNITQWDSLFEKGKNEGVIAGVMIWFIDHDITIFIPIQALEHFKRMGDKSVNCKELKKYAMNNVPVTGVKKRVFFEYDMEEFLRYLYSVHTGEIYKELD